MCDSLGTVAKSFPFTVGFLITFSSALALSFAAATLLLSASIFFCSSKTEMQIVDNVHVQQPYKINALSCVSMSHSRVVGYKLTRR